MINDNEKDKDLNENIQENDDTVETVEENAEITSDDTDKEENQEEKVLDFEELKALKEENMLFKNKTKKLENELEALKDRLLRINAEYENYRKRTDKEKERIYTDACEDVLTKILPVLDNLERAVAVDGTVDDLKKGVEMTVRQFQNALENLQVEEIDATGQFDPNLHQPLMHAEDENYGANEIAEVFQKGYKRGDKVIRHTMVKVVN
ncbi:nucleotide exchange factor GrpE [Clostridium tarantellae]|uniref:Protein GrpE n=1 Tax=Clostridium tarantellae TaxID=39493 RepID=A0A6I1MMV1_9CLOT|nr:nucleotide exchange factor GrpE [Clostridium tarantellae]